jgi:hypothetical protein
MRINPAATRTAPPVIAAVAAALMLTGCSVAEDAASDAADAAKDRVAAEASAAAANVVQQQICAVVGDSSLSDADLKALADLADQAEAVGVRSETLDDLRAVADGGKARAADLKALQESCPN